MVHLVGCDRQWLLFCWSWALKFCIVCVRTNQIASTPYKPKLVTWYQSKPSCSDLEHGFLILKLNKVAILRLTWGRNQLLCSYRFEQEFAAKRSNKGRISASSSTPSLPSTTMSITLSKRKLDGKNYGIGKYKT